MKKEIELENKMAIYRVKVDDLIEQDVNPQVMGNKAMDQLSRNIKGRGALEQLPFCTKTDKGLEIISGHHRIRAARQAGVEEVYVLVDESKLTRDDIIAKQLAHNEIVGKPNQEMVKQLFLQIEDVEAKIESFVDPKVAEIEPGSIPVPAMNAPPDFKLIALAFLPAQLEDFDGVIERLTGGEEEVCVATLEDYERFKEALSRVRDVEDIKHIGMAVSRMSQIVLETLADALEKEEK